MTQLDETAPPVEQSPPAATTTPAALPPMSVDEPAAKAKRKTKAKRKVLFKPGPVAKRKAKGLKGKLTQARLAKLPLNALRSMMRARGLVKGVAIVSMKKDEAINLLLGAASTKGGTGPQAAINTTNTASEQGHPLDSLPIGQLLGLFGDLLAKLKERGVFAPGRDIMLTVVGGPTYSLRVM